MYFPPQTGTWDTRNPADLGWCQENIDSLNAFLAANNSKGFLLLDKGKIALEWYYGNFTKDSLWYWASAGKTLTAMLVGIAQQEGYLALSDSSSQYLGTGWTSAPASKEGLITVRNQLASFMVPGVPFVFPGPLFPDAPADMYAAQGKDGQIISVVPSKDLVWVRMGESPNLGNGDVTPVFTNDIWKYINRLPCSSSLNTNRLFQGEIWPNPGQNVLRFKGQESPNYWRIFDAMGRLLAEGSAQNEWWPGELPNGLYQIEVQFEGEKRRFPWVRSEAK
ncbi:MAG: serine hydrolase [Bacteroidetes bacterium]|nr:serine hydrolase [Bacteroidota bacterium]